MSERTFRFVQGVYLLYALYFEIDMMIYVFMAIFLFEAVTNWRVPMLVSRVRYGPCMAAMQDKAVLPTKFSLEAERVLRIIVATFLLLSFVIYSELLWFVPWFMAVMILLAGITNVCILVMFLRHFGFR